MHNPLEQRLRQSVHNCSWTMKLKRNFFFLAFLPIAWFCFFLLLAVSDALVGFGEAVRYGMLAALICAPLIYISILIKNLNKQQADFDDSCRLLERAIGDEDRHVTASIQLATLESELAQRAVEDFATSLPYDQYEAGLQRQPYGLLWLAMIAIAASVFFMQWTWPGMLSVVSARLAAPWSDNPPYSRTRLALIQMPETIQYEEKARVVVRVEGLPPEEVLIKYRHAGQVYEIYCFQIGDGTWGANIGPIKEDIIVWGDCHYTRSRYGRIALNPEPVLKRLLVSVDQPSYTGLKPQHTIGSPQQRISIRTVDQATITLECIANRDVSHVLLAAAGKDETATTEAAALRLPLQNGTASFVSPGAGSYTVQLIADNQHASPAYSILHIDEISDNKPEAFINVPKSDAVATPGMVVPLEFAAEDDFGLSAVYRIRAHNFVNAPNIKESISGSYWEKTAELDIKDLGVAVGDTISIGIYVTDNKPGSPQISETVTRHITIISDEAYNKFIRDRASIDALNQKYKPIIDEMQEILKRARESEDKEEQQQLLEEAKKLEEKVKEMQRPDPLYAVEPEIQEELIKRLQAIQEAMKDGDKSKLPDQQQLEQMKKELKQMEALAKGNALMEQFKALTAEQRKIAEAMKILSSEQELSPQQQKDLDDLSRRQQANEERLKEWQRALAETVKEMKEQELPQARELEKFGRDVKRCEAGALMQQSSTAAAEKDAQEGAKRAEQAAERLESLMQDCENCQSQCQGQGMSMCSSSKLSQCLSQMQSSALGGMGLSQVGTGRGGSGAAGPASNMAMMGGMNPGLAQQAQLEIFGPEKLKSQSQQMASSQNSRQKSEGGLGDGSDDADNRGTRESTAYQRDVRDSTAVMKVHLSKQEEELIKAYFIKLNEAGEKEEVVP